MKDKYDLVVVGAGPGGFAAAIKAAQKGLSVAVVERDQVGGTCLNRGCVPTKTLMHASNLYREMQACDKFGLSVQGVGYDIDKLYARKDEVVQKLRGGMETLLAANGVDFARGAARITGPASVQVTGGEGDLTLAADKILVASGSVPARLPIPGMELPGVITSDDLLDGTPTDYESLVIIGGGVIGMEFATVFSALGCKVTVLEAMDRILPTMDKELAQSLSMVMKKRGAEILTGARVSGITGQAGRLACRYTHKETDKETTAQGVLVATGRWANFEGLFAEGLAPRTERGLVVNDRFETSLPGVYAIGDVIQGGIQLAHVSSAQGINAVCHMVGQAPEVDLSAVPACVYTDPEIASVGLTAAEAKTRSIEVKTGKYAMGGNAKCVIEDADRSFIKVVFDAASEKLLGAQLMCPRATDLVSELSTAISNGLAIHELARVIRPHPTFTEAVTEAVEDVSGSAIHLAPRGKL